LEETTDESVHIIVSWQHPMNHWSWAGET